MKIKTSVTKPGASMEIKTNLKAGLYSATGPQGQCKVPPCNPPIVCNYC
jgi:hypothetical protein